VKAPSFAYARARSVDHAIELLTRHEGARVLAGGQSLVPLLNMRLSHPALLVDINRIPGLDTIARSDGHITLGALVRHAAAESSELIASDAPLIARAMPHIGHAAIRSRGTLGGSIALADPAAELPACLLALGGEVEISGPAGRRLVTADHFFRGLFETALGPQDVLVAIRIPVATVATRIGFAELARRHGDYAMVGLAASARAEGAALADVRLAYFGIGLTPLRARGAEAALTGAPDPARLEAAVAALADDLDPPDDVLTSAAVKKHLAGVLLRRVARELGAAA
jgi:carbon-monoxide dehydrogenase medium subunit